LVLFHAASILSAYNLPPAAATNALRLPSSIPTWIFGESSTRSS
jgi:hypothetical protein